MLNITVACFGLNNKGAPHRVPPELQTLDDQDARITTKCDNFLSVPGTKHFALMEHQ